ncbi:MAG: hypothetical protein WC383_06360 [Gammaproteobacteria bacterium]
MVRRLIFGVLFTVFALPAVAGFKSQEDVAKWMTFYYQAPDVSGFPEAIEYMSRTGVLDKDSSSAPIFGFIAGVFKDNPALVKGWVDRLGSLKEEHLGVVVLGLWYADLPESRALTYAMLDRHPRLNYGFSFLRTGTPIPVTKIPLEQGPWVLDALWGNFMATGRREPVERIMAALPWFEVKGDLIKLLVGGAARWSLTSNAIQHDRVFEFCEKAAETQPEEVALELRKIVDIAREKRQNRHDQALSPRQH